MDDIVDIVNMEERIIYLEKVNAIADKKTDELRKILEMPFIKRMKLKSQVKELKRLEEMQRNTFEVIIKRHANHLTKEWKDLFAEYFIDLMNEKVKSINDFLFVDRLAPMGKRVLKERFIDR